MSHIYNQTTDQKQSKHKLMLRKRIRPRVKGISFNRMIPNLLTILGLCAGLIGIRSAIHDQFKIAVLAILIAGCFDGLDGRIARFLRGTSRFGAELDSLADFLSFGVAPSFILYMWSLKTGGDYAFVPCAVFTVCMALRLARFNAALDDHKPQYANNFFTGVPAPAAAGIALFPVFLGLEANTLHLDIIQTLAHSKPLTFSILLVTAFLAISTLPIWSFKNFKIPTPYIMPLFLGTCIYAVILVADPWGTLALTGLLYLGLIPLSYRSFHRLRMDAQTILNKTKHDDHDQETDDPAHPSTVS